jgi:hypothetical protein
MMLGQPREDFMTTQTVHDVLGVLGPDDIGAEDGWEIIMNGEETRRPKSLTRVAITRAEVTFSNEANLKKFVDVLEASDKRLRAIPDAEVRYDWQRVLRKNLTVRFGVAWYDREFYLSRRDAYKSEFHSRMLRDFGLTPEDMRVEHIPL